MKKFKKENIIMPLFCWVVASFIASGMKAYQDYDYINKVTFDNCGKNYPIDYILYTNLFCEIED